MLAIILDRLILIFVRSIEVLPDRMKVHRYICRRYVLLCQDYNDRYLNQDDHLEVPFDTLQELLHDNKLPLDNQTFYNKLNPYYRI